MRTRQRRARVGLSLVQAERLGLWLELRNEHGEAARVYRAYGLMLQLSRLRRTRAALFPPDAIHEARLL